MEQEIIAALNDLRVKDILGERIYFMVAPEGVQTPYCRFFEVVTVKNECLSKVGMDGRSRYQFDLFGPDAAELKQARELIIEVLGENLKTTDASTRASPLEQDLFHSILDISIWD